MTRHSLIGFAFVCTVSLLVVPTQAQGEDESVEDEPSECEVWCWDELADGTTRCALWLATCTVWPSAVPAFGQMVGVPACLAGSLVRVSHETLYTYTTVCSSES